MVSALVMALIAIVYVIQAFKIPTGSMKVSLLVGISCSGLSSSTARPCCRFSTPNFPASPTPSPAMSSFSSTGLDKKDYIKRCVAGPGQTIQ